ncbi:hypothetical protein ACFP51_32755 [Streptomyces pratens]|uniref:Uncharacterized protein n=1 Tax=Streptomyces pratens TaxID=887456 RepID=A0ABW1MB41_9ACTN
MTERIGRHRNIKGDRLPDTAIGLAALGAVLSARLLYQWIRSRTQVQLTRLIQQGSSDRVRALPPGSKVTERRAGEELRIEVGADAGDAHD